MPYNRAILFNKIIRSRHMDVIRDLKDLGMDVSGFDSIGPIEFQPTKYSKQTKLFARMSVIMANDIYKFFRLTNGNSQDTLARITRIVGRSEEKARFPLFGVNKSNKFVVYPNMLVSASVWLHYLREGRSAAASLGYSNNMYIDLLNSVEEGIVELNRDPKTAQRINPLSRYKKTLRKTHIVNGVGLLKILLDAAKINKNESDFHCRWYTGMPDHYMRDAGQSIDEAIIPPKLKFAETYADAYRVFENGKGSCMTGARNWTKTSYTSDSGKNGEKVHPANFYIDNPNTRIAYMERNGKVCARAVLLKQDKAEGGRVWAMGRVYNSSGQDFLNMIVAAEDTDDINVSRVKTGNHPGRFSEMKCEFRMPLVNLNNGDIGVCLPYTDNISMSDRVIIRSYSDTIKDGHVTIKINTSGISEKAGLALKLSSGEGLFRIPALGAKTRAPCKTCNEVVDMQVRARVMDRRGSMSYYTYNGYVYCSRTCLTAAGLLRASTGEPGNYLILNIAEPGLIKDAVSGEYYTNLMAAKRRGLVPVLREDALTPEEDETLWSGRNLLSVRPHDRRTNYLSDTFSSRDDSANLWCIENNYAIPGVTTKMIKRSWLDGPLKIESWDKVTLDHKPPHNFIDGLIAAAKEALQKEEVTDSSPDPVAQELKNDTCRAKVEYEEMTIHPGRTFQNRP